MPDEDYIVIADNWKLIKSDPLGDFDRLEVVYDGKVRTWWINRQLLLADPTYNPITNFCVYPQQQYLKDLSTSKAGMIKVEVVAYAPGGPLNVVGLWPLDFKREWETAVRQGSRLIGISDEDARALKSPEGYENRLRQYSELEWTFVRDR